MVELTALLYHQEMVEQLQHF